ncbi:E3 ubiquitin-protein ligase sina [Orchesella cincta]|uniref:RING-type E3 ubiquitin transferase n=1 Tax=Orchesella cincta TaxID=48709 RepID=A0A1D2MWD9_ORCCI|nr:E3 ubiquitin-protein ligase sina [Orchesella cincta]
MTVKPVRSKSYSRTETLNSSSCDKDGSGSSMGEVEQPVSDDELLRIMECPVCNEFPAPPIFSCEKGHFTCSSCMKLLKTCSLCRAPFTTVRNFALESIIENSNFKCRNAHLGCPEVVKGGSLNHHVAKCLFGPFDCTEPKCIKKNLLASEYLQHMMDNHEVIGCKEKLKDGKVTFILKQNADAEHFNACYIDLVCPKSKMGSTFFIFSRRYKTFMCYWATCLQPENLANYNVRFSLEGDGELLEDLALHWTLPVLPISEDFNEIRDTGLCAVIPETHLVPFYIKDTNCWNLKVELIQKVVQPEPCIRHYWPLILLVVVGIFAVLLTLFLELGLNWFQTAITDKNGIKYAFADTDHNSYDEYVGYRGFYYKAR